MRTCSAYLPSALHFYHITQVSSSAFHSKLSLTMGDQIISVVFYLVAVLWCSFVYEGSCQTSLSSQDQQELLNVHNHYRGLVSPTASNMETMVS